MEEKIRLDVLGITTNQLQAGAYALLLAEHDGSRRIPVVIGASEAQSIAAKLENVTLPRPLVHDMFHSVTRAFGIFVKEVFIYRFSKGVFYSEITFVEGDREVKIDSRMSDAVAIAIRTKTPIYTNREVMDETSFDSGDKEAHRRTATSDDLETLRQMPLERFAVEELEKMLGDCIANEEYERASEIKHVIDVKKATT